MLVSHLEDGIQTLTLDRPQRHNCFDDALVAQLTEALQQAGADIRARVVMLTANGPSFSAGADLDWMRRLASCSRADNEGDALALARMLQTLYELPKPTIALVQGPAFGGGIGLVACCDIVLAADSAYFALSEVKLGLIPGVISPYLVAAIGARAARRYVLTGERFEAREALRLGLVHAIEPIAALETEGRRIAHLLLRNAPQAMTAAKELLRTITDAPIDEALGRYTAGQLAEVRASDEGKEGIAAFLEKRKPRWAA